LAEVVISEKEHSAAGGNRRCGSLAKSGSQLFPPVAVSFCSWLHATGFHVIDASLNRCKVIASNRFLHLKHDFRVNNDERLINAVPLTLNTIRVP
jgi:hypothetical protein